MDDIVDVRNHEEKMEQYRSLQYDDFQQLSELFEEFLFTIPPEFWTKIVKELADVLNKCDEIDYQSDATAIAYAIWHFLDRYHRIQMMCAFLLENGCLNRAKQYDVLDVGTGPSQVLFALSDHFQNLNDIEKKVLCTVNPDYVEQSAGFRDFLHHFVQYSMSKGKQYLVPFHLGRTQDAFDISFQEYRFDYKCIKFRYDIVVFNNFLTTKSFTESYAGTLKKICKYVRNHGLIIVIGSSQKSKKYREIYPVIDEIIIKPFKDRSFHGYWVKVFDREFNYKYEDAYGQLLGDYFKKIVAYLQDNNLWESVPDTAKKEFMERSEIPLSGNGAKNWNGITWKMVVYRKFSRPNSKKLADKKTVHKNFPSIADDMWKRDIETSRDDEGIDERF